MQDSGMRRLAIAVFILECLGFGAAVLVVPNVLVETINGADPIAYGWIRWAGADLIAMGIGALLILRKPGGPGIVRLMALVSSLGAAGSFIYSRIADEWDGALWFLIAVVAVNGAIAVALVMPQGTKSDPESDDTIDPLLSTI